jgi:hypothetical protein
VICGVFNLFCFIGCNFLIFLLLLFAALDQSIKCNGRHSHMNISWAYLAVLCFVVEIFIVLIVQILYIYSNAVVSFSWSQNSWVKCSNICVSHGIPMLYSNYGDSISWKLKCLQYSSPSLIRSLPSKTIFIRPDFSKILINCPPQERQVFWRRSGLISGGQLYMKVIYL